MKLPIFQVDAFTNELFGGNPASVMPLTQWLNDEQLQAIAMENNQSETAFFVAVDDGYELRWFTPTVEVPLCGHATLAAAHVLRHHLDVRTPRLRFLTASGELTVVPSQEGLTLNFPAVPLQPMGINPAVSDALGAQPLGAYQPCETGLWHLYEFASAEQIVALNPDFAALKAASEAPVVVTAPGEDCDFVSRFFAPQVGVDEDPVTGSAHCLLTPFWAQRLDKPRLEARQLSVRGGHLLCELDEDRVLMSGSAVTYLQGEVELYS